MQGTDCLKLRCGLYINCTTLKLDVHITYTASSVLVQEGCLYTYDKVRY